MSVGSRLALAGVTAALLLPAAAPGAAAHHDPVDLVLDDLRPPSCPLVLDTGSFLFGGRWCASWPRSASDAAFDEANYWASAAVPDQPDLLLGGIGHARAAINGNARDCYGASQFVLEASHKPGSLEPTVAFAYGGATGSPSHALACAQGQLRQPMRWNIDAPGGWSSAWSAQFDGGSYAWSLAVGAPQALGPSIVRHVEYHYASADGLTRHDFAGDVYEYR